MQLVSHTLAEYFQCAFISLENRSYLSEKRGNKKNAFLTYIYVRTENKFFFVLMFPEFNYICSIPLVIWKSNSTENSDVRASCLLIRSRKLKIFLKNYQKNPFLQSQLRIWSENGFSLPYWLTDYFFVFCWQNYFSLNCHPWNFREKKLQKSVTTEAET